MPSGLASTNPADMIYSSREAVVTHCWGHMGSSNRQLYKGTGDAQISIAGCH